MLHLRVWLDTSSYCSDNLFILISLAKIIFVQNKLSPLQGLNSDLWIQRSLCYKLSFPVLLCLVSLPSRILAKSEWMDGNYCQEFNYKYLCFKLTLKWSYAMSVVKTAQEPGLPYAVKGTFWCESMLSMSGKSKNEIW